MHTVNGDGRILDHGRSDGRARANHRGARTGKYAHSKPVAGMEPRCVAHKPAGQRRPAG